MEENCVKVDLSGIQDAIIVRLNRVKRQGMVQLIEYLKSKNFFTSPASSKYHLSCKGGLAYHSLQVYYTLQELTQIYWNNRGNPDRVQLTDETITIVALLHDLCKLGLYKWDHTQEKYIREDDNPIGHGDKSVILIQQFIKLTDLEIAMIRWHMGPYDAEYNRNAADIIKKYPEAKLLYFADDISTHYRED